MYDYNLTNFALKVLQTHLTIFSEIIYCVFMNTNMSYIAFSPIENIITVIFLVFISGCIALRIYHGVKDRINHSNIRGNAVLISKYTEEDNRQTIYRSDNEAKLGVVEHCLIYRGIFELQDEDKQVDLEMSAEAYDGLQPGMKAELVCKRGRLAQFGSIVELPEKKGCSFRTMKNNVISVRNPRL